MSLLAYNKTTAPLALAAGNPIVTIPAAASAGGRGAASNVTAELISLTGPDYTALQAQVSAQQVEYEWSGLPEFNIFPLVAGSAQTDLVIAPIKIFVNSGTGNDANPGTEAEPIANFPEAQRRASLFTSLCEIILDADGIGRVYQTLRTPASATPFNIVVGSSGSLQRLVGPQGMPVVIKSKALTQLVAEQTDAVGGYNFALQGAFPNSTLTADPGAAGTTLSLVDASLYPTFGMVKVENELIRYTGKAGNDLTGCTRGYCNTTAAAHAIGVNALLRLDGYFVRVTDGAVATTLNGAISDSATSVVVANAAAMANAGYMLMPGGEIITYSSKTGNTLNNCVRGYNQTTPAAYANGTAVMSGANILQRRQVKYNTATLLLLKGTLPVAVVAGTKFKVERTATTIDIGNWLPQYSNAIFQDLKLFNDAGPFNFFSSRFSFTGVEIEQAGGGSLQFAFNAGLAATSNIDISLWQAGGANIPVGNFEGNLGLRIERISGATTITVQGNGFVAGGQYVLINAVVTFTDGSILAQGTAVCMRGGSLAINQGASFSNTGASRTLFDRTSISVLVGGIMRLAGMDVVNAPTGLSAILSRQGSFVQLNNVGGIGSARYGLEAQEGGAQIVDVGVSSTLTADPGAAGTTLSLTSAAAFGTPAAGSFLAVQVENEIIFYTGKAGNDLTGCIRGMQGTVAAAHAIGIVVEQGTCIKGTLGGQKAGTSPVRSWVDFFAAAPASGRPSRNTMDAPGFGSRPFKLSFVGMAAADAIDITAQGAFATPAGGSATVDSIWETTPPAIANGSTLRVTAGAAAFVGNYALTDAAGTLLSPLADTVVGVAQLSDDGKTITFPVGAQVTAMVIEYIPVSGASTGARIWQAA